MKTKSYFKKTTATLATLLSVGALHTLTAATSLPKDTNPALLYWREFATLPDVDGGKVEELGAQSEIDSNYRDYVARFDNTFRRLNKVRRLNAPCNWGDDLDEGPELLLPYLAKARDIARIARLRVRAHLNEGDQTRAVNELLSVYSLSGHIANSPILINLLVHYGMDRISARTVAENLGSFNRDALSRLQTGIAEAPKGMAIADTIDTERHFMAGWIRNRLQTILDENSGDKAAAKAAATALMESMLSISEDESLWQVFEKSSVKDVEGVIRLLDETNADYDRLEALCRKPLAANIAALKAFDTATENSNNAIRRQVFPAISKAVARSVGNDVINAMVITAIKAQLEGEQAFAKSVDPVGGAPFKHNPFRQGTTSVGFILESSFDDDRDSRFLFLTKPVPGIQVSGDKLGTIR